MADITKHARRRTKEKVGISKKLAEKNADKALQFGLTHAETRAGLKRFCDALYLAEHKPNNLRIYHGHAYLFRGQTLITIIPVPHKFAALAHKLENEKVESQNTEQEKEVAGHGQTDA